MDISNPNSSTLCKHILVVVFWAMTLLTCYCGPVRCLLQLYTPGLPILTHMTFSLYLVENYKMRGICMPIPQGKGNIANLQAAHIS